MNLKAEVPCRGSLLQDQVRRLIKIVEGYAHKVLHLKEVVVDNVAVVSVLEPQHHV
jgi:hypothetical protein